MNKVRQAGALTPATAHNLIHYFLKSSAPNDTGIGDLRYYVYGILYVLYSYSYRKSSSVEMRLP